MALDAMEQTEAAHDLAGNEALLKVMQTIAPAVQSFTDLRFHIKVMRDALVREVLGGNMLAMGYALPRDPADKPVFLPDDIWAGKIKWDQSEIIGKGLHFVSVRLIWNAIGIGGENDVLSLPAPKAAGRPSLKEDIINAYRHLESMNRIDFKKPMSAFYETVKNHLMEACPDKAGVYRAMSNETIRLHTAPLFKESRKQKT